MLAVSPHVPPLTYAQGGYSLRFYGNGVNDIDRVKIRIDNPPGPPADVGATDFTLEFWMRAYAAENGAGAITCGNNNDWILANIIFDRDRFNYGRKYGLSIAGGVFVFGVVGAGVDGSGAGDWRTICGTTNVLDAQWHHIAVQRRRTDGWMWLYVDGRLEAQADGPNGDISYPDGAPPSVRTDGYCQGPGGLWGGVCVNDPYLVIAAEKHDAGSAYPSYNGWVDEVRLSNVLRYSSNFARPSAPFATDSNTVALYHFDEGPAGSCTGTVPDTSGAAGGPSNGTCSYGGSPNAGPLYTTDTPFGAPGPTNTPTRTPTRTPTHTATPTPPAPAIVEGPTVMPLADIAVVNWQTNVEADSRVRFDAGTPCGALTRIITSPLQVISHSIELIGLSPSTAYCFQVQSGNSLTDTLWTAVQTFTTLNVQFDIYLPTLFKGWSSP